jgi:hypothetical protein
MGISDSYLLHLVTMMAPQTLYHPRLPAPFPGGQHQFTPVSMGSAVSPDASRSWRSLASSEPVVSPGSPGKYVIDLQA